ncbi:MAG: nicotinate (nicotinamide) nucleotide adenylyltransferase [Acidobacteria bacterium SCN 69-37]|nr:MAG: nicotinate (nicotinamide) nucleotide adenylyltransferase [Acidobacteria bacterium SCN 69-37]
MKAVGLFGGTFDPIHQGHLDVARAVHEALSLETVRFIPARRPPHRTPPLASAAHRFAMTALAIAGDARLRVSDAEMDQDGPSFTIDTLDRIERIEPARTGTFVFITGSDAFRDIRTWHRWPDLLDRCHFAVVSRVGLPAATLREALPDLAARMHDAPCPVTATPGIFLVDAATAPVSSTELRQALTEGAPVDDLLPDAVAEYAVRHGLYRAPGALEAPRG